MTRRNPSPPSPSLSHFSPSSLKVSATNDSLSSSLNMVSLSTSSLSFHSLMQIRVFYILLLLFFKFLLLLKFCLVAKKKVGKKGEIKIWGLYSILFYFFVIWSGEKTNLHLIERNTSVGSVQVLLFLSPSFFLSYFFPPTLFGGGQSIVRYRISGFFGNKTEGELNLVVWLEIWGSWSLFG